MNFVKAKNLNFEKFLWEKGEHIRTILLQDEAPQRSLLQYQRNMLHPYMDNNNNPPNPHFNLSKYPFGVDSTDIIYNNLSKGHGEELRRVAPVQSAMPQHQLTASFNPPLTARYANTNTHFRQKVLNSEECEFNDQYQANSHDSHGLPHFNHVGDSGELVTATFSNTVAAHRGMQPVPHGRKLLTPMASTFPLPDIPGSLSSQTM